MTSNIEQTTNSFLDYPPPLTTHARAHSGDNVWDFALRERHVHVNVAMEMQFVQTLIRLLFREQAEAGLRWLTDLSFQISSQIAHTQKTSTPLKNFSINSKTPRL